jgi:hypothetical protein
VLLLAGIAVAVLLPSGHTWSCPSVGFGACHSTRETHFLLRFAVALGSAIPLIVMLARASLRRWLIAAAVVTSVSALALAVKLPGEQCPAHLGNLCAHAVWWRSSIGLWGLALCMVLAACVVRVERQPDLV